MPQIKFVQKRIFDIENFEVTILNQDGGDMRDDKDCPVQYPYVKMAKNNMSVADWINTRFNPTFVGYKVKVLKADGSKAPGNMNLCTVRDTYIDVE